MKKAAGENAQRLGEKVEEAGADPVGGLPASGRDTPGG